MIKCVCVTGLWDGQYDQIIKWWGSNQGQCIIQTQTLTFIVMYLLYLLLLRFYIRPHILGLSSCPHHYILPCLKTSITPAPAPAQGPPPTWDSPVSIPESPNYRSTNPSAPPPPVPHNVFLSLHRPLLDSCKISSKVALSYVSSTYWQHHASLLRPHSSYPAPLAQTSNISCTYTHCSTTPCLRLMQVVSN